MHSTGKPQKELGISDAIAGTILGAINQALVEQSNSYRKSKCDQRR